MQNKMNQQFSVLLYSKYSNECVKLMNDLDTKLLTVKNTFGITPVCIDNENIRKQILSSDKISITTVPCILLVYTDGGVEKYDGYNLTEWLSEMTSKYQPQQQPVKKVKQSSIQQETKIEDLDSESSEAEDINSNKPPIIIRNGSSNYDIVEPPLSVEETETTQNLPIKSTNLMATAMAMQKEREVVPPDKRQFQ